MWPEHEGRGFGDNYCFIALARKSRLVAAWHLGKRDKSSTVKFIAKVKHAVKGKTQISTDAYEPYVEAIGKHLGKRASYARIVKVIGPDAREPVMGNPDMNLCETTYIERLNGSLRLWMKRMNRKTYAFSKKWANLHATLALQFAHYNFVRIHGSFKETPAMRAGLVERPWIVEDLVGAAA